MTIAKYVTTLELIKDLTQRRSSHRQNAIEKMSSVIIHTSVDEEMLGSRKNAVLIVNILLGPVHFTNTFHAEQK
jgi:hypothetical protein